MDVVERLTLEAASSHELIACEHRHRYEFAAALCRDRAVLDLCCGSGYGSEILAATAREVAGVDNDVATIDMAQATVGARAGINFEVADAVAYLRRCERGRFEVIVCFEGLEHLQAVDDALALLREHAEAGSRMVVSLPNSKLFEEDNPHHVTDFGYEEAIAAFSEFPEVAILPQYLAEGSLIAPTGASGTEVSVELGDRDEPGYANHFIICANFPAAEVASAHHGHMQLEAAPAYNRHMKALERAYADLRRANARLARARLGKSGSAAASYLAKADAWRRRAERAEARISELEREIASPAPRRPRVAAVSGPPAAPPDRCMNTWEDRYRRARENLIPWVESTISLEGKTVLEYGCGNAPVSCAFAERAGRHIGLDIDPAAVETGREMSRERGIENLELGAHPLEEIREAMAAHRGEVDVVLLYAVLEHLTIDERLDVLRLAQELAAPRGHIVVCETPNRLFPIDHHTSHLPFFTMLPDELALMLYEHSRRPDFLNAIAEAMREGPESAAEALTRWGRGVSFHEFELVFGDLSHYLLASNYEPALFAERPVHPEELGLWRLIERLRPDLAPVWSRAWLDLILAAWPLEGPPSFLRPWSLQTLGSPGVAWTGAERLRIPDAATPLSVSLPVETSRVVVGAAVDARRVGVNLRPAEAGEPLAVDLSGEPGQGHYASFELPQPAQAIEIGLSRPGEVFFVGYEG
jgi:2-polyprenyl-3-methyl-5-hydroxy-6-metoxy-1,4-benzoquinol methylase